MNAVDLLLIAIVLYGAWTGWRRGFLRATLFLVTMAASLVLAFMLYRFPAEWLQAFAPSLGVWVGPLGFVLTWLALQLLLDLMVHAMLAGVPWRAETHAVNRLLGLAPGVVNGLVWASVVALALQSAPAVEPLAGATDRSQLVGPVAEPAQWLEARLLPIFDPAIRQGLRVLIVPPESHAVVRLPFKTGQSKARPELEAQMLEMVNAERAQHGLRPLAPDPQLAVLARAHSRDMLARGYFSHDTPEGGTMAERMRQARVSYLFAGENLAFAHTLAGAHRGLMNSPGHRANVLRPQFGRVGIGVLDSGPHGLMITQEFRN